MSTQQARGNLRVRRVFGTLYAVLLLVLFPSSGALASNSLSYHWPQNPGGGYSRWVNYVDQTNAAVYGNLFDHVAALYYYADNRVYPYEVSSSSARDIDAYSGLYYASWYGLMTPTYSGSHLSYATVQLDEADGLTSSQNHSLICQELGHALGLDHQTATDSCMYPTDAYWPEDFNTHDTSTLWGLYGHTD